MPFSPIWVSKGKGDEASHKTIDFDKYMIVYYFYPANFYISFISRLSYTIDHISIYNWIVGIAYKWYTRK